ncbi:MAG TPA: cation diffusion facilitator family transporter [Nocardioidaceae bacterium]|jgi:cation diffusion facilitator family transporter|nr:cation diffusion facilitator family transporter [Nocardioidaceae bacterium]
MSAEGSNRAILAALFANLGIATTKFIAWILTHSSSMLAEAIHSVADSANQVLLLVGRRRSTRAPTTEHQFGFGRERYLYAFIVAVVLFSVGGLFAMYEAYHKYHEVHAGEPNELLTGKWWWVPLVVLSAAIVMESFSLRTAIHESNKVRDGQSWQEFIQSAKSPELPVVLLEDTAALLGLVFALIGVGMTLLTDNGYWDAAGTAAIGLLLVCVAVVLAIETKSLLLGEAGTAQSVQRIQAALEAEPRVARVIHLRTMHLGPDDLLVATKVAFRDDETAADIAISIDAAEQRIREAEPVARWVYIEPDIFRADHQAAPRPVPK